MAIEVSGEGFVEAAAEQVWEMYGAAVTGGEAEEPLEIDEEFSIEVRVGENAVQFVVWVEEGDYPEQLPEVDELVEPEDIAAGLISRWKAGHSMVVGDFETTEGPKYTAEQLPHSLTLTVWGEDTPRGHDFWMDVAAFNL